VTSDVDKNIDDLPLHIETGLTADDSVGLDSLDNSDGQQTNEMVSAHKSELHDTCTDEGDTYAEPDGIPSAVLQTNGEFMCSSCGVVMKCARAVKRHMSIHTSQLPVLSTTSCHKTADRTDLVNKDSAVQNRLKKKVYESKKLPRLENNMDGSKEWRSYVCKDCGEKFTASALVDLHRVQMHRPHKCQKCGMILTGRRSFSQHVRKEHPGMHICKVTVFICYFGIE